MPDHTADQADPCSLDTSAKALAVFFRIADLWSLNPAEKQKLLGARRSVFHRWEAGKVTAT